MNQSNITQDTIVVNTTDAGVSNCSCDITVFGVNLNDISYQNATTLILGSNDQSSITCDCDVTLPTVDIPDALQGGARRFLAAGDDVVENFMRLFDD